MPDIKLPYTPEGEELVENIKEEVEAVGGEVDYAPGGTTNAPDTRENYQLGGKIPGQLGFGERPMVNPLPSPGRMPGTAGYVYDKGGKVDEYKEGGKTKK